MREIICIVCPNGCSLKVDKVDGGWTIAGNLCPKGKDFAVSEMTNPTRSISSTVRTDFKELPRLPVRTDGEIPLQSIFTAMEEMNKVLVHKPVHIGDIIIKNICDTGVNIIAAADMYGV